MLKRILVTVAMIGVTAYSYGQGTVNFATFVRPDPTLPPTVDAPVTLADGTTRLAGTAFLAQLYSASGNVTVETALTPAGAPVNFRGGNFVGYVQTGGTTSQGLTVNPTVTVTPVAQGAATLQVRAWDAAFATYELALAGGGLVGTGPLLFLSATGGPGTPPATPSDLLGLEGFAMVPEPSTLALGALGLAALLFRRRK